MEKLFQNSKWEFVTVFKKNISVNGTMMWEAKVRFEKQCLAK